MCKFIKNKLESER